MATTGIGRKREKRGAGGGEGGGEGYRIISSKGGVGKRGALQGGPGEKRNLRGEGTHFYLPSADNGVDTSYIPFLIHIIFVKGEAKLSRGGKVKREIATSFAKAQVILKKK